MLLIFEFPFKLLDPLIHFIRLRVVGAHLGLKLLEFFFEPFVLHLELSGGRWGGAGRWTTAFLKLKDLQLQVGLLSQDLFELVGSLEFGFPDLLDRGFPCLFGLLLQGLDYILELCDLCPQLGVPTFQLLIIILIVFHLAPQNIHIRAVVLLLFLKLGYFLLCLFQKYLLIGALLLE